LARSAAAASLPDAPSPSGDAGVALALRLGEEAVRIYAELHGVSPAAARDALRRQRALGRRPSVANPE
jgi:hypothetical protein